MGSHYQADFQTPFMWAFWKNYTGLRYVEEKDVGSEIYFFAEGKGDLSCLDKKKTIDEEIVA